MRGFRLYGPLLQLTSLVAYSGPIKETCTLLSIGSVSFRLSLDSQPGSSGRDQPSARAYVPLRAILLAASGLAQAAPRADQSPWPVWYLEWQRSSWAATHSAATAEPTLNAIRNLPALSCGMDPRMCGKAKNGPPARQRLSTETCRLQVGRNHLGAGVSICWCTGPSVRPHEAAVRVRACSCARTPTFICASASSV